MLIKVPDGKSPGKGVIFRRGIRYNLWEIDDAISNYPIISRQEIESDKNNIETYLSLKPKDAYEWNIFTESICPDTLAFIETPKMVYVGRGISIEKYVNLSFCQENKISIIQGIISGRGSYFYRNGDAIWLSLSTKKKIISDELGEILLNSFKKIIPNVFLEDNDIRIGNKRVCMIGPCVQDYNHYLIMAEIIFDVDFEMTKKALKIPKQRWINKPVDKIEDWLLPLNSINISKEEVKKAILETVRSHFNILKLGERDLLNEEKSSQSL